jgi:hypothetical protein
MKIKLKLKNLYKIIEQMSNPVQEVANILNEIFPLDGLPDDAESYHDPDKNFSQLRPMQQPILNQRLKLASDLVRLRELISKRNDITITDVTYNIIQLLKRYHYQDVGIDITPNNKSIKKILDNIFGNMNLAQHQSGNQLKQLIEPDL